MVISELERQIRQELNNDNFFEAEQIIMSALNMTREKLILNAKREITDKEYAKILKMTSRRKKGEPLQYILGSTEFMSLEFFVGEGVLIPRQDTETFTEIVLDMLIHEKAYNVLDICTGSGCIGISLAYYRENVRADLIDISDTAAETARRNAAHNDVEERVSIYKCDILKEYPDKKYDIIVSNPPYIESDVIQTLQTEVRDYEPHLALDGGADGLLFYRRIIEIAPKLLNKDGIIAFEIGYNQGEAVSSMMSAFNNVQVIKDLCGNDRVVTGIWEGDNFNGQSSESG